MKKVAFFSICSFARSSSSFRRGPFWSVVQTTDFASLSLSLAHARAKVAEIKVVSKVRCQIQRRRRRRRRRRKKLFRGAQRRAPKRCARKFRLQRRYPLGNVRTRAHNRQRNGRRRRDDFKVALEQKHRLLSARAAAASMERDMESSERKLRRMGYEKCIQRWMWHVVALCVVAALGTFAYFKITADAHRKNGRHLSDYKIIDRDDETGKFV